MFEFFRWFRIHASDAYKTDKSHVFLHNWCLNHCNSLPFSFRAFVSIFEPNYFASFLSPLRILTNKGFPRFINFSLMLHFLPLLKNFSLLHFYYCASADFFSFLLADVYNILSFCIVSWLHINSSIRFFI